MCKIKKIQINEVEVQIITLDDFNNVSPPIPANFNWQKYDMPGIFTNFCAQEIAARIFEASFIAKEWCGISRSDLSKLIMMDTKYKPGCFRNRDITIQKNVDLFWEMLRTQNYQSFTPLPNTPDYKTLVPTLGYQCLYDGLKFLLGEKEDFEQHHIHTLYDDCEEYEEMGYCDDYDTSPSEPMLNLIKVDDENFYAPTKQLIEIALKH